MLYRWLEYFVSPQEPGSISRVGPLFTCSHIRAFSSKFGGHVKSCSHGIVPTTVLLSSALVQLVNYRSPTFLLILIFAALGAPRALDPRLIRCLDHRRQTNFVKLYGQSCPLLWFPTCLDAFASRRCKNIYCVRSVCAEYNHLAHI